MVVSPRYAEYADAHDTGTSVPVLLPPAASLHSPSADSFPPTGSSPALAGSQADAATTFQLEHDNAAHAPEVQHLHQATSTSLDGGMSQTEDALQQQQRQDSAQYYLCNRGGVDHVFVDHPMYCRTSDIYGSSTVNTYQEAGDFPDLDLRYSILCQAALAAPLLLWNKAAQHQSQHGHNEQQQTGNDDALVRGHGKSGVGLQGSGISACAAPGMSQLQLQLPQQLHLPANDTSAATSQPVHAAIRSPEGLFAAAATPLQSAAGAADTHAASAALPLQASALHMQGGGPAASSGAAALSGSAPYADPDHRQALAASQQLDTEHAKGESRLQSSSTGAEQGRDGHAGAARAPLVFVSNDWPCAPLALRLRHTLQSAQASQGSSAASLGDEDSSRGSFPSGQHMSCPGFTKSDPISKSSLFHSDLQGVPHLLFVHIRLNYCT